MPQLDVNIFLLLLYWLCLSFSFFFVLFYLYFFVLFINKIKIKKLYKKYLLLHVSLIIDALRLDTKYKNY